MTEHKPYLTDAEILEIAAPLKQRAAIRRWFEDAGFTVKTRPNGMPLILRAEFDRQHQAPAADAARAVGPNVLAFTAFMDQRNAKKTRQPARPA